MHVAVAAAFLPPREQKALTYYGHISAVGDEEIKAIFEDGVEENLSPEQVLQSKASLIALICSPCNPVGLTQACEAITTYCNSGRSYIGARVRKKFFGTMYNGTVMSFAGKAGTEYVRKGTTPGGNHDYWKVKWEDRDASELSKAELQAASQERSEFEREAAHRIDATLVVPGGYDLQAIASFVPSEIGQMVASLKVSTTSEAIQSLKLLEGHDGNRTAAELGQGEFIVEKIVGHTALREKPTTTVLSQLPKTARYARPQSSPYDSLRASPLTSTITLRIRKRTTFYLVKWQGYVDVTWEPKGSLLFNPAVWRYECPDDSDPMETEEQAPDLPRASVELQRRLMSGDILLTIDGTPIGNADVLAPTESTRRITMSCVPTMKASKQLKLNDLQKRAAAVNGRVARQPGKGRAYKRKPETFKEMADYSRPGNLKKKSKLAKAAGSS